MRAWARLCARGRAVSRGDVPAGVLDSIAASLGTFLVGLMAVRYLELTTLGTYALSFTAFLLAGNVSGVFAYTPAEALIVASTTGRARVGVLPSSLRLGLPVGTCAALVVSAAVVVVPSTTPVADRLAMAVPLLVFSVAAPAQDHLRRVLHAAGRSWEAVSTSLIRLLLVGLGIGAALVSGSADSPAAPFGVLALATTISAGFAWTRAMAQPFPPVVLTWGRAVSQGGVLVIGSVAQFAAGFLMVAFVTASAGATAIAEFEAARLVSQPVTVVIVGVLSVLGPRAMTSAGAGDRHGTLRRIHRQLLLIAGLTLVWTGVVSVPSEVNLVRAVVPRAFDVPLLLPFVIVMQAIAYAAPVYRVVPLVMRVSRPLLGIELAAVVASGLTAAVLIDRGPWAVAVASGVGSTVVLVGCGVLAVVLLPKGAVPASASPGVVTSELRGSRLEPGGP